MYVDPTGYRHIQWRKVIANVIIAVSVVATFWCEGCGAGVGAVIGEAVGGYNAHRTGGDYLRGVINGGIVGGVTGYAFGYVGDLTKGMNPLIQIGAKGLVGGTISDLSGGSFIDGFIYAGIAATLSWGYEKMVGFEPTVKPGEYDLSDGQYIPDDGRPPEKYNVVGKNIKLEGDYWGKDFWKQGGPVSTAANKVPGINATAGLHDYWMNKVTMNFVTNVGTMVPAAAVTYGGLLSGPLSPILMDWTVRNSSKNNKSYITD